MSSGSNSIQEQVEALLFVADAPATAEILSQAIGCPIHAVEEALEHIGRRLNASGPVQLVKIAGGYQMATKPTFAPVVARFLEPQAQKLSKSLLETLAVVAYRQPITAPEVEEVRGVDSSYTLRTLAERRLIVEVGRKQTPGRPVLWGTSQHFLHMFNLPDLQALPQLDNPALMEPTQATLL
ncbi:MAG: SMC-Scp complex subunit ScpB [Fimbriimonadaceae bacterium]|nr:SMC-Scp complex subunit ScpB [Fimbriimonadaceae bacterium]